MGLVFFNRSHITPFQMSLSYSGQLRISCHLIFSLRSTGIGYEFLPVLDLKSISFWPWGISLGWSACMHELNHSNIATSLFSTELSKLLIMCSFLRPALWYGYSSCIISRTAESVCNKAHFFLSSVRAVTLSRLLPPLCSLQFDLLCLQLKQRDASEDVA